MNLKRLDHVALEVGDLDHYIALFERAGALRLIRRGMVARSGQRMAMLGDGTGVKIELIEKPGAAEPRFLHMAFQADDVAGAAGALADDGWTLVRGPNALIEAQAQSALMTDGAGLYLQVVSYAPTSPDVAEWPAGEGPGSAPLRSKADAS